MEPSDEIRQLRLDTNRQYNQLASEVSKLSEQFALVTRAILGDVNTDDTGIKQSLRELKRDIGSLSEKVGRIDMNKKNIREIKDEQKRHRQWLWGLTVFFVVCGLVACFLFFSVYLGWFTG